MRSNYLGKALATPAGRRPPRALWIVPPCLLLGLGGAAFVTFHGLPGPLRVWEAGRVEIAGNCVLQSSEVLREARLGPRPNWLFLDCARVRDRLLRDPWIASARVARVPWRRLRLEIRERVPEALVPHRGALAEMDAEGVLLPLAGGQVPADVPTLTGLDLDGLACGARVGEPRVAAALDLLGRCRAAHRELWQRISEVRLGEPGLVRLVLQGLDAEVWLRPGAMGPAKLAVLEAVLPHLERTVPGARVIDLRFRDQVVVQANASPAPAGASNS
ncbi:MAG TPA: FtsQ-type POTRA domain-containing protein [Candidatus Saccharimonadales bacterium]|nr:FtsQ-type POTRA domain-containing protein [Candidatus Saccharimonadales bacterium]